MQRDLVAVTEWTKQWGMRLNLEKCKVLHFGRNNPKASYILGDRFGHIKVIGQSKTDRDLEVMIAEDVKWKNQVMRFFTLERLVPCTDKTTSGVRSTNLESTSDWRYRET